MTGQIEVARGTRGLLNYENNDANRFELVVQASDQGGRGEPALHTDATVEVTVTNINEPPIAFSQTLQIAENAPRSPRSSGERVGDALTAVDEDSGDEGKVEWAVESGDGSGFFELLADGDTGATLTLTAAGAAGLDYET